VKSRATCSFNVQTLYICRQEQASLFLIIMGITKINSRYKKWLIALFVLLLAGASVIYYLFTLKYDDTADVKADYTVNAPEFIKEFQQDMAGANKKYSEKIIVVNGMVSAIEAADTTANIKMMDTTTGAYIIFAFQQQHLQEAKQMKAGDRVSIKGSCSNGAFSNILDTEYITFKRCAVNK
jgi:tRNA_anti-like